MVLKLYGSPKSAYSHVVAFILHEKEVPFELELSSRRFLQERKQIAGARNNYCLVKCLIVYIVTWSTICLHSFSA